MYALKQFCRYILRRLPWNQIGFSLPGMVTPTLDINELDKRITDLKAVEGWLKMNLNMLQMTTQGLEMQRAALAAVKAMSECTVTSTTTEPSEDDATTNPFMASMAMWPWNLMNAPQSAQPAEPPQQTPPKQPPAPRTSKRKTTAKKNQSSE